MGNQLSTIRGVEVFSTGTWNGDEYTTKDLDAMVSAFNETSQTCRPALKLGHSENQTLLQEDGYPAAGWIGSLYRVGEKLVADLIDIPKQIYELIQNKAYRNVSSEIYWNIDAGEKTYSRMLAAVALLGADMPAVMNLKDILANYGMKYAPMGERKYYAMDKISFTIESIEPQEASMNEQEIAKMKADLEAANKALTEKDAEVTVLTKFKSDSEAEKIVLAKKAEDAQLDAAVDKMVAEKVITPGVKAYARALIGEEKKTYSFGDKEKDLSKADLLKKFVTGLSVKETISTKEQSVDGEHIPQGEKINEDITKYMTEHKVSYSQGYRAVMRGKAKMSTNKVELVSE